MSPPTEGSTTGEPTIRALHHVDLWVDDLDRAVAAGGWLFDALGWTEFSRWDTGRSWAHPDGTYLGLEASPDLVPGGHDRHRAGLNHLALTCPDQALLDELRAAASGHGWQELFADRYPDAGGPGHIALFLEHDGFEVEVVVTDGAQAG